MGTKSLSDSINSRVSLLNVLHRTGKIPKDINLSKPTVYSLLNKWESVGIITISRKGRDLSVILTQKGKEFVSSLEKLGSLVLFL